MKKNVLIIVIVAVLVVGGVVAWYFLRGSNKNIVTPNGYQSNPQASVNTPVGGPSASEAYGQITQAQKDCLFQALGQKKLDGLINNDNAVMQTITADEYTKVLACPQ